MNAVHRIADGEKEEEKKTVFLSIANGKNDLVFLPPPRFPFSTATDVR
jgi:hypothetical protein